MNIAEIALVAFDVRRKNLLEEKGAWILKTQALKNDDTHEKTLTLEVKPTLYKKQFSQIEKTSFVVLYISL